MEHAATLAVNISLTRELRMPILTTMRVSQAKDLASGAIGIECGECVGEAVNRNDPAERSFLP